MAKRRIEVEHSSGSRYQLDLGRNQHRHLDYGYAVTIRRALGATAYPILNAPSYRANTIHLTSVYVGISRPPGAPFTVTDSRDRIIRSLGERAGLKSAALDQTRETAGLAEQVIRDLASQRHRRAEMEPAAGSSACSTAAVVRWSDNRRAPPNSRVFWRR